MLKKFYIMLKNRETKLLIKYEKKFSKIKNNSKKIKFSNKEIK